MSNLTKIVETAKSEKVRVKAAIEEIPIARYRCGCGKQVEVRAYLVPERLMCMQCRRPVAPKLIGVET